MYPISCTKSNTWSSHKDSPLFEIVLPSFWVFESQIKTKEEIFLGDTNTLKGQLYLSHHLHKVKHAIIKYKESPFSKTFLSSFWGNLVFALQFKTREEISWVTPASWGASFMSPISCTKSNTQSVHKDSPLSKTVFFWGGTKSLHHRSRLRKRFFWVTPTP